MKINLGPVDFLDPAARAADRDDLVKLGQLALSEKRYAPDQPRDDTGRWAGGSMDPATEQALDHWVQPWGHHESTGKPLLTQAERDLVEQAVARYGKAGPPLYRGEVVPAQNPNDVMYLVQSQAEKGGGVVTMPVSSYSASEDTARPYAGSDLPPTERGGTGVMYYIQGGAKALDLTDRAEKVAGYNEDEWVTAGRFELTSPRFDPKALPGPTYDPRDGLVHVWLRPIPTTEQRYSEDQPRDESGKWSAGGGSSKPKSDEAFWGRLEHDLQFGRPGEMAHAEQVYEAQQAAHFWDRSDATPLKGVRAAQHYADEILKTAGAVRAKVRVDVEPMGLGAGRTDLNLEPHNYVVKIDPHSLSETNVIHEMAHVIAAERSGDIAHDRAFRDTLLELFKDRDPALATSLAREFSKQFSGKPARHRAAAPKLIAIIIAPDGKVLRDYQI